MTDLNTQMSGESLAIAEQRKQELKQLFPGVFTEIKNDKGEIVEAIDYERLKAELGNFSEIYDNRRERYGMDWPGKRDCLRLIQEPSRATLKPCRDESVEFDKTENLFIEGDNLEVLKLLQKAYYGKVKMIYIDPPYNTGKEFIYPDNFSESLETYLSYAGLSGDDGKKFSTNSANEGRFHTKWLNMMFPRLYLARNLLREDGVIFISIDDNEVENLRRMCDEIFGEENFLGNISVVSNLKGRSDDKHFANAHNYLLAYSKNDFKTYGVPLPDDYLEEYPEIDEEGRRYRLQGLRKRGANARREDRPNMYYPFYVNPTNKKISLNKDSDFSIEVYPLLSDDSDGRWRWGAPTAFDRVDELIAGQVGSEKRWDIFQVDFSDVDGEVKRIKPKSIWLGPEFSNESGTREVKEVLGKGIFDTPKPKGLIKYILEQSVSDDDIVLDFFSGSSSTADACMAFRMDKGVRIKYIQVQIPERLDEKSNAFSTGFVSVADIGKERIRRAGQKIRDEISGQLDFEGKGNLDLGFKVLKLGRSNFKHWQAPAKDIAVDELAKQFELHIDHIDPNASQEDILYELLIKAGVMPTEKIELIELANHAVFSVGEGGWLICLQDTIEQNLIDAVLAKEPVQFICLDRAFHGNDQLKANAIATFADFNQGRDKADQIEFRTV
ncbi:site-specific DNA-methyltransferase [Cellvibrio sp. QJXJ]|uniref:site-specific DNA-methyltransferase n=1 Tax=Cellvibrio sp. QJXJ TaxID=2964606 RepID=UPI0021C398C4|nr:site-specific DNA-methyltransferase [Cellvibrio sp. QJXJ]UUA71274.1 site-specific DNA-methyltransferase [Cellvibrio sp. QJXJ]